MKTDFKIKFDGQLNQVDANTLVNSLFNITAILQEINNELDPDKRLDIKVNAFSTGSFNIDLELAQGLMQTIFSKETVTYTAAVLSVLVSLHQIKKFLKGDKAEKVVESENGDVVLVSGGQNITINQKAYHIYSRNTTVNEAMNKNFETLSNDSSIEGFEITDKNEKPLVVIEREYFPMMTNKNTLLERDEKTKAITDDDATLNIFKLVFHDKHKWEFYYKGNRINAKILDDDFFKSIDSGRKFSKGDTLKAELQINQVYDPAVNTFLNKSYEVVKVKEHTPREEHPKLDFPD